MRRLSAVQTLGSTNVIFTDKTGTLTENRMTLRRVLLPGSEIEVSGSGLRREGEFRRDGRKLSAEEEPVLRRLLEVGVLCNNASLGGADGDSGQGAGEPVGDPMEVALLMAGAKAGFSRQQARERKPEAREVAFDPQVKMMATIHRSDGGFEAAVKGAPDAVLERCTLIAERENKKKLSKTGRRK